jgi:hypothetical protein
MPKEKNKTINHKKSFIHPNTQPIFPMKTKKSSKSSSKIPSPHQNYKKTI